MAYNTRKLDVQFNSYYIAGATSEKIYLANITNPFHLLVTNYALTDTQHVRLKVKDIRSLELTKYIRVRIDSPYFYMMDGLMPGIFKGRLGEWTSTRYMYDSAYFSQSVPVGDRTIAIRTRYVATNENCLGRVSNYNPHIKLEPSLLEKQIDGVFCTDGKLLYNKSLNKLIYTYYYRNQFIVYDTNLDLSYRGNTIDTFSRAQVEVAKIASEKKSTLAKRPKFVNLSVSTSGENLFVNSGLLAKNDMKDALERLSMIDIYDLNSNKYKFSFHVGFKIREFYVHKNRHIITLSKHQLAVLDLKSDYF